MSIGVSVKNPINIWMLPSQLPFILQGSTITQINYYDSTWSKTWSFQKKTPMLRKPLWMCGYKWKGIQSSNLLTPPLLFNAPPHHQPSNQNLGPWLIFIMNRKEITYPQFTTMASKMHHSEITGGAGDLNFLRKTTVFTTCQTLWKPLTWAQWVSSDLRLHDIPFNDTLSLWSWTVNHYFGK